MGASAEGYSSPGGRGAELIAAGKRATAELNDYIREQLPAAPPRRRAGPHRDDGRADYACAHMTEQEIVASNTQLVFAGNETTAKLLAQIVVTLAAHPDQRARSAPTALIPAAVEEVHRFETISHSIFRDAVGEDAAVGDVTIPEGERITLLLAAANRDPARWEHPDQFDVPGRSCRTSGSRSGCTAASA